MQSVNGAQFLKITSVSLSSALFPASSVPAPVIVVVPLTSMYVSLQSHKLDFNVEVSNLIRLLVLYVQLSHHVFLNNFLI